MKIDGNAPAFPQHGWTKSPDILERMQGMQGITVRALIAKDMMAAILGNNDANECVNDAAEDDDQARAMIASLAVKFADALIAELSKE